MVKEEEYQAVIFEAGDMEQREIKISEFKANSWEILDVKEIASGEYKVAMKRELIK